MYNTFLKIVFLAWSIWINSWEQPSLMTAFTWPLNKVDYESLTGKTAKMILKRKDAKVNKMYARYQNLWRVFVANNNIIEVYDDVTLVRFFKSRQNRYSPSTIWVVYSCLNSRFINEFGINLNHPHKFLKNQTQLYVAT